MGKSLGNVLDPEVLLERCGRDAVRWYLLRDIPFGEDGDFQQQRFTDLVNSDLANTIGNLLNRTSSMARKWFAAAVPPPGEAARDGHPLAVACREAASTVNRALEELDFRLAAEAIVQLAGCANGYLNDQAPWKAMKQPGQESAVAADLYAVLEASRWVALLLTPLLPDLSARMLEQLGLEPFVSAGPAAGAEGSWQRAQRWGLLAGGAALPPPEPVMQRLELDGPL
jgi:methionyl-tRNA synthetase